VTFRHVVLLTFHDDTGDEHIDAIVDALRGLPAVIPELRTYDIGRDAGINDGNADLAVVATFDDEAGYLVYRDHPAHQAVIADLILPLLAARTANQHDT
jgi:hypothetical protein